ncbi:hypothetical protein BX070DRAFT_99228 [Coemansia spiralis]|nr:hypothetical protein BX070DRAFT_99228 [Coemansia spiralis]
MARAKQAQIACFSFVLEEPNQSWLLCRLPAANIAVARLLMQAGKKRFTGASLFPSLLVPTEIGLVYLLRLQCVEKDVCGKRQQAEDIPYLCCTTRQIKCLLVNKAPMICAKSRTNQARKTVNKNRRGRKPDKAEREGKKEDPLLRGLFLKKHAKLKRIEIKCIHARSMQPESLLAFLYCWPRYNGAQKQIARIPNMCFCYKKNKTWTCRLECSADTREIRNLDAICSLLHIQENNCSNAFSRIRHGILQSSAVIAFVEKKKQWR